ncbi:MAG: hypothetical protein JKP98_12680 [Rhodobacteraceae bacterium]|jgi:hypothetical protein|nr:hypothetical protein [Alphaproteobacteria bacterium]MBL4557637.1 hypothetical protein [Paracoccaceae bacterium]
MKEIGNARRYKILAEGETFITIQDVEDKDKRVLKVPISQVEVKNKSFGEDFTLFAEVAFPPWCEAVGLSVFDERSKRIVVIVDIDGTVADCAHRVHLAQATEWDEFHALSPYDTPKFETVEFIKVLQAQGYIIFGLTGRDEKYEQMTSSWLVKYRIPLDYTFMRPSGNRARDCDLKPKMLIDLFGSKENVQEKVLVVLEDRDRVVEAFREMGLPCWQVQAGGY